MPRLRTCIAPLAVIGLLALIVVALAAQTRPSTSLDQHGIRFRSSVDLVRLSVTAKDANGQILNDLTPEEFEVYEDGRRQELGPVGHQETPLSVVVLLDTSGSMAGEKLMHESAGRDAGDAQRLLRTTLVRRTLIECGKPRQAPIVTTPRRSGLTIAPLRGLTPNATGR